MSDIYLRDMDEAFRAVLEKLIRIERKDLVPALDDGEDIIVGETYDESKRFSLADNQ